MLPYLNVTAKNSKKYTVAFKGINYGEERADGEFSESQNISTAHYPCLSQRSGRKMEWAYSYYPTTLHAKDGLFVVDGVDLYFNREKVGRLNEKESRKQIATVGNYIVIFPDKLYYNLENDETKSKGLQKMDVDWSGSVSFTDTTITTTGDEFPFRVGDAITISGCSDHPENNKTVEQAIIIRGVDKNVLTFYENSFTAGTETGEVTLKRDVPDLDFICESNYRLWGTKGNTIYSSKFMDPLNFNSFDASAADSYAISVGSDGEFTGCAPFSSHICFFKENTLHKLYGSKPSNFQIVTSQVYGVQAGSERSICIINETLFYKGVGGVYAYTGGVPELVSGKFGVRKYSEACAATDGSRYYISMREGDNWNLFVYDVRRNLWVREDDTHCVDMAFHDGHVYFLKASGGLYKVDSDADKSDIEWSVTFCPFNETVNERKGYSKFHMRLELAAGSWLTVEQKRNDEVSWQKIYSTHNEKARTVSIPVVPARCDSVEIRVSGKGECLLRTFIREFFTGSDV